MRPNSLDILYEDNEIIVCIKPSGTATQSRSIKALDMESLLKNHIARNRALTALPQEPYLAVIHRLDQPVQGIMVFAKTPAAAKSLNKELKEGGFGKHYRALVSSPPRKPSGTLENYILENKQNNTSSICQKGTPKARYASLSYKTVLEGQQYFKVSQDILSPQGAHPSSAPTELDIRLHTGRHHQIRIQLAGIGCPIIGDTKYNPAFFHTSGRQELKLCSYCLEFTHPKTKKKMLFSL